MNGSVEYPGSSDGLCPHRSCRASNRDLQSMAFPRQLIIHTLSGENSHARTQGPRQDEDASREFGLGDGLTKFSSHKVISGTCRCWVGGHANGVVSGGALQCTIAGWFTPVESLQTTGFQFYFALVCQLRPLSHLELCEKRRFKAAVLLQGRGLIQNKCKRGSFFALLIWDLLELKMPHLGSLFLFVF